MPSPMLQMPEPGTISELRPLEAKPSAPVMVNCGIWLATATPMSALAECNCASAARTSGRCSTSCEGRLSGRSCGSLSLSSSKLSPRSWSGERPTRRISWLRCWASCFCNGGNVARVWVSVASWASTSAREAPPRSNWRRTTPSEFSRMRMMSWVALICACSEARLIAATTTLDVSDRYVASSWKRCTSASASFEFDLAAHATEHVG